VTVGLNDIFHFDPSAVSLQVIKFHAILLLSLMIFTSTFLFLECLVHWLLVVSLL